MRVSDGVGWAARVPRAYVGGLWRDLTEARQRGWFVLPAVGVPPMPPRGAVVLSPNPSPIVDGVSLTGPRIRFSQADNPETLSQLTLAAGTVVEFERGARWANVRVVIRGAGTATQPVLIRSTGSGSLPPPSFTAAKPGRYKDDGVLSVEGTHVHVRDLLVRDSASIAIGVNAADAVVHNVEVANCVHGFWVRGDRSRIWNSFVRDGRMMPDTPGTNDDYGAGGVTVEANDVVVEGLTGHRLHASSPDYDQYGGDGALVEVWMKGDRLRVSHCYAETTPRILEAGGIGSGNYARDMTVRGVAGWDIRDQPIYLNPVGDYSGIVTTGFSQTDNIFVAGA